jgi:hypothetical protein
MKELIIRQKYESICNYLTEKSKRLWCGSEAVAIGRGGISLVSKATGISRTTITRGVKEVKNQKKVCEHKIRSVGGGRKSLKTLDKTLTQAIDLIIESSTLGNPETCLLWCSKSLRNICKELKKSNHRISHTSIGLLLKANGYSLQANRKTQEGCKHEDRDAQFHFINNKVIEFQNTKNPCISVDTKKKENIGNYKNNGQEYRKQGSPECVKVYDFVDEKLGKVAPYGIYDLTENTGWVSVGISSDTAQFAVNSIRNWWNKMGSPNYKDSRKLLITADCGGSNGNRVRLWKTELQKFANEIQKEIHVCHFPPGTSKWNKIEHRMFSFISKNWRGKPLLTRQTVVSLIGNTKTTQGLRIEAMLDEKHYEKGIEISDEELQKVNLHKETFHGEWNYKIFPK